MAVTTALGLVVHIENTLGWTPIPTEKRSLVQLRRAEAAKIKRKIQENPDLYTWRNLELAVALLQKKQKPVTTPLGIFYYVDEALNLAAEIEPPRPLEDLIGEAVCTELTDKRVGYDTWVDRLIRARGPYRQQVYDEWTRERRDT